MHDAITRSYLDVEIVLEDMVFVLLSIRFYLRIVAFCMVFIALIALAAYLQTLPSIFQTSDFLHAAMLRINSQTAYLHNGYSARMHAEKSSSPWASLIVATSLTPKPESRWKQQACPSVVSALRHPVQQKPCFACPQFPFNFTLQPLSFLVL